MHSWDDFRYFYAVATHGSFSVAGKELGVNHSTVSRRIQMLEERHGVRLFERTHSGYAMTEAGTAIFEIVEQINECSLKASRVLLGQDSRLEGKIRVTLPHEFYESCMVEVLKNFVDRNPAIELSLAVTPGLRDLANREADIAIRLTANPPDYLVGKRITHIQHGIYVRTDLRWQAEAPIIVWGGDKQMPAWAEANFDNPKIALRIDDLASMHAAVAAGYGIARMPCFYPDAVQHQPQNQLQNQHVGRMPIEQPPSDWGVWLLSHVDLRNTARINHCKTFLTEGLESRIPLFTGKLSRFID